MTSKRPREPVPPDELVPNPPPTPEQFLRRVAEQRGPINEARLTTFLTDDACRVVSIQLNLASRRRYHESRALAMCLAALGVTEAKFFAEVREVTDTPHKIVVDTRGEAMREPFWESVVFLETKQYEELMRGKLERSKDDKAVFPVLVISGDSGAGKTTLAVLRAHLAFQGVDDSTNVLTYYVKASKRSRETFNAPAEPRDKRNEYCCELMKEIVQDAMNARTTRHPQAAYIHIVIDECGAFPSFIRGAVSELESWNSQAAPPTVLLTLCSTGADRAVEPKAVASDPDKFHLHQVGSWTEGDCKRYFGGDWPSVSQCAGLRALASNPRCASLIREELSGNKLPWDIVRAVAGRYRGLNGLCNIRQDGLERLVRISLVAAVLEKDLRDASIAGRGVVFNAPAAADFEEANRLGLLTFHRGPGSDGMVKLSNGEGHYEMSVAVLVMSLDIFGTRAPFVSSFGDLEVLSAVYYGAVAVAVGLRPAVIQLPHPVPPTGAAATALNRSPPAVTARFPATLTEDGQGWLQLPNGQAFSALLNGPRAPTWDAAVGWRAQDGETTWYAIQVKYTADGPDGWVHVDWPAEASKLGLHVSAATDAQNLEGARKRALTAFWVQRTMNVSRRILMSNGKVAAGVEGVEVCSFPGPFAVLANDMIPKGGLPYNDHKVTIQPTSLTGVVDALRRREPLHVLPIEEGHTSLRGSS